MLQLYTKNKVKCEPLLNYSGLCITEEISALPTIEFDISSFDAAAAHIEPEGYIETKNARFVIKEVQRDRDTYKVFGIGDAEKLSGARILNFEMVDYTVSAAVNALIVQAQECPWTVQDYSNVKRLRSSKYYKQNAWDILKDLETLYHVEFKFDTLNYIIYIYNYNSSGSDKGAYFIDKLNLENLVIDENSQDFATMIFPYGKDKTNITSVNEGKYYISDYTYSDKKLRYYWIDDRYKKPSALKEDAEFLLEEMCKPRITYSVKIRDLASISDTYSELDYSIGDTVRIISEKYKLDIKQRIVKLKRYPQSPEKNTIELSTKKKTFADAQAVKRKFVEKVEDSVSSDGSVNRVSDDSIDGSKAIKNATITSAKIGEAQIKKAHIGKAEIGSAEIGEAAIGSAHIQDASITNAKIEDGAIGTAQIGNAVITTANIADGAITNAQIVNGTIETAKIADAAITSAKIENGAITTALIDTGAIGTAQIADGSITDAKIVGLTANKITAGTLDAGTIDVINLNAANITVGTINGQQIASGTIGLENLSQTVIDSMGGSGGGIKTYFQTTEPTNASEGDFWYDTDNGNKLHHYAEGVWTPYQFGSSALSANSITAEHITGGAITTGKIGAGAITTNELAVGAVTGNKIAGTTITGDKIATGTITASQIATNAITTDKIVSGAITANKIAAGTITANQIAGNTITSAEIRSGSIKASDIDVSDLFSTNITATNMNITGGSINILSAGSYDSTIYLVYSNDFMNLGAGGVCWGNYNDNYRARINKTGISVENHNGSTSIGAGSISTSTGNFSSISTGSMDASGTITANYFGNNSNFATMVHTNNVCIHTSTTTSAAYCGFSSTGYLQKYKSSSRRYKHNIAPLDEERKKSFEKLYGIELKRWTYNDGYFDESDELNGVETYGLIAEEVNEIIPEIITHEDGKIENFRDRELTLAMLYLVQEQKKEIDILKDRVKQLEVK